MTAVAEKQVNNGVNVEALFGIREAFTKAPEAAKFNWKASCTWAGGTHSRTKMKSFYGAGGEHMHQKEFIYDSDHPAVLVGADQGPTPVEFLLHSLASCLTAGIGNIAAARGVTLHEVEATVEGDIDLQGILGLSNEVRNGYQGIRVNFKVKGDAPEEKLQEIVARAYARSAVFDSITKGVPVSVQLAN